MGAFEISRGRRIVPVVERPDRNLEPHRGIEPDPPASAVIVVSDADPRRANEKLIAIERIINGRGFVTIRERTK